MCHCFQPIEELTESEREELRTEHSIEELREEYSGEALEALGVGA